MLNTSKKNVALRTFFESKVLRLHLLEKAGILLREEKKYLLYDLWSGPSLTRKVVRVDDLGKSQ